MLDGPIESVSDIIARLTSDPSDFGTKQVARALHDLGITHHDRLAPSAHHRVLDGLSNDLRADAGGIPHRDRENWLEGRCYQTFSSYCG